MKASFIGKGVRLVLLISHVLGCLQYILMLLPGKFVGITGTVVRVGDIRPLATTICFVCNGCNSSQVCKCIDGKRSSRGSSEP